MVALYIHWYTFKAIISCLTPGKTTLSVSVWDTPISFGGNFGGFQVKNPNAGQYGHHSYLNFVMKKARRNISAMSPLSHQSITSSYSHSPLYIAPIIASKAFVNSLSAAVESDND